MDRVGRVFEQAGVTVERQRRNLDRPRFACPSAVVEMNGVSEVVGVVARGRTGVGCTDGSSVFEPCVSCEQSHEP